MASLFWRQITVELSCSHGASASSVQGVSLHPLHLQPGRKYSKGRQAERVLSGHHSALHRSKGSRIVMLCRRPGHRGASMYAPSRNVYQKMTVTQMGLWIDRCGNHGRDLALVLKCPTHVGKALHGGSSVRLILAEVPSQVSYVRCFGFQVEDRSGKPLTTFAAYRTRDEQRLLSRLLHRQQVPLFLFDEIERCVACCVLAFEAEGRGAMDRAVNEWPAPYAGRFTSVVVSALDRFSEMLDDGEAPHDVRGPIEAACLLTDWRVNSIYGIGSGDFRLDGDDGSGLEQTIHQLLESLFGEQAFRSPNVQQANGHRELIDTLLLGDHVICLVESKAVGFAGVDGPLDTARLAKRVQKDLDKGLRQLKGATRTIRGGMLLTETHQDIAALARTSGTPIDILDPEWAVLGVVVVSDLECDVNWTEVADQYVAESSDDAYFQAVDLTELRGLVGAAKTPMQFVTNLILRWQKVKEHRTMAIRARIRRES